MDEQGSELADLVECAEFYDLMQVYRHAPVADQKKTGQAYEAVKRWIGRFTRQYGDQVARECAEVARERISYAMPISCPDGMPGCCVLHTVPGTRDKTAEEVATAILELRGLKHDVKRSS